MERPDRVIGWHSFVLTLHLNVYGVSVSCSDGCPGYHCHTRKASHASSVKMSRHLISQHTFAISTIHHFPRHFNLESTPTFAVTHGLALPTLSSPSPLSRFVPGTAPSPDFKSQGLAFHLSTEHQNFMLMSFMQRRNLRPIKSRSTWKSWPDWTASPLQRARCQHM